jgi:hypothetical protein
MNLTEILRQLRTGRFNVAEASVLDALSARELMAELQRSYPVKFQERDIGRKHEVALARSIRYELGFGNRHISIFSPIRLLPVLRSCVFASCYGDSLSEITTATYVYVKPTRKPVKGLILKMGRGFKLDKSPDGWALNSIEGREVNLSLDFLEKRGWQFDVFVPFRNVGQETAAQPSHDQ